MDKPTTPNPADFGLRAPGTEEPKRLQEAIPENREAEQADHPSLESRAHRISFEVAEVMGVPALSDLMKRKLAIVLDTLRDKQKLTDGDLADNDRERQQLLKMPDNASPSYLPSPSPRMVAADLGLDQSLKVAEGRFREIDCEYWSRWCSSGEPYETYAAWLEDLKRDTLAELQLLWKGRSAASDAWFEVTCKPTTEKALSALIKRRIAEARDVEVERLGEKIRAEAWMGTVGTLSGANLDGTTEPKPDESKGKGAGPAVNASGENGSGPGPELPKRAAWLKDRLKERSWNKHDLARCGGPDHKTTQKILDGFPVREDVLQKVADGLSKGKVNGASATVSVLNIPD